MHRGGELRQSRDLAVVVRAQLPRRRLPVPADVDVAGDDQRRSAAGDRPVEVDEFRRDEAVVAGPRLRGCGLVQASRQRQLADASRGEQQSVVGCHYVPRQVVAASYVQPPAVAFVSSRFVSFFFFLLVPCSPPSSFLRFFTLLFF